MKVLAYWAYDDGSAHYRLTLPVHALAEQGMDVALADPKAPGAGALAATADLLVVQRPHAHDVLKMVHSAHEHGVAVCVDLDDDFDHVARTHSMYWVITEQIKASVHAVCQAADLVTVTTPKLAELYGYGHSVVIPNFMPRSHFEIEKAPHDELWVGWTGTVSSHPNDLQTMGNGLRRALADHSGSRFVHVGGTDRLVKASGIRDVVSTGSLPYQSYLAAYARFDVGIVPLDRTVFNEAKSILKGLEAASLGVPFVATPTYDYRRIAADGIGLLAKDPSDWRRQIGRLLASAALREDLAETAKQACLDKHTVEGNADRWAAAWQLAVLNYRANAPHEVVSQPA